MSHAPTLLSLFLLSIATPGDQPRQDPARQEAARPTAKVLGPGDAVTIQLAGDTFHGLLLESVGKWVHLRADDGARMAFPRETVRWVREGR